MPERTIRLGLFERSADFDPAHTETHDPPQREKSPLEEVSWDEAIHFAADKLKTLIRQYGPDCVMGAGSARGPGNEAAYITQKFMRAAIGTNNVDHCARI